MTTPTLDWVQTLGQLNAGVFGNAFDPTTGAYSARQQLTANNPDYQAQLAKGTVANDAYGQGRIADQTWSQAIAPTEGVDWTQLPTMGPAGFQMPANTAWATVGGRSGYAANPNVPIYNDPNYGELQLGSTAKAPNDLGLNLLKAGAIAMFAGPTAAALGGAAGLGSFGQSVLSGAIKAAPTLATTHWTDILGGTPNATAAPAAATTATPAAAPAVAGLPTDYNPSLFGNTGSLAAPPDGSAAVMSSLVPGAYDNSNSGPTSMVVA